MKLYLNTRRNGYGTDQCGDTLTVRELIEILENYDEDMEVFLRNDDGYTYGSIYEEDFEEHEEDWMGEQEDKAMLTIYDLTILFIDSDMQEISIYDITSGDVVWKGTLEDVPDEYLYEEITSIDNLDNSSVLGLNIELEEE